MLTMGARGQRPKGAMKGASRSRGLPTQRKSASALSFLGPPEINATRHTRHRLAPVRPFTSWNRELQLYETSRQNKCISQEKASSNYSTKIRISPFFMQAMVFVSGLHQVQKIASCQERPAAGGGHLLAPESAPRI